ncbi:MAG: hypothetical protein HC933_04685 [Pleurocapsa sp. SU_196_0]|nr:hypothetical protein [Pleurocapsa sp. SU_196_0]
MQAVSDTLPAGINLEFDAMYTAMLSHDLKINALLHTDGKLTLRGVAFRSVRFEPFGARFLERTLRAILENDLVRVRNAYLETLHDLRSRTLKARDVATVAKLKKPHAKYLESRGKLREAAYEAALQSGKVWLPGERIRWYRASSEHLVALPADPDTGNPLEDATNYDVAHYVALFERTYVKRLEHAFTPDVFQQVFRSSAQEGLFDSSLEEMAVRWV